MNDTAYRGLLGVIDDSIGLAEEAIKEAEAREIPGRIAAPAPAQVTLVKVASAKARSAAVEIMKTGAFKEHTETSLAKFFQEASPTDLLVAMEKLAAKAVFPFDADILSAADGDLVEKPAAARGEEPHNESRTDLWARCCEESGIDVGG